VRDYRILVLGLDPKDTGADAARMRQQQIGNGPHSSWAFFLRADEAGVKNAASSVGYHFAYDAEHDQFAHPAAVLVLAPDGRVTRVLSGLGLTSDDLTLALVEAAQGHIGGLGRQLQLLCYGFDPAIGVYTLSIHRALAMASGFMVVVVIAGLIALSLNSFRSDG
jgi:protein SCO1/2